MTARATRPPAPTEIPAALRLWRETQTVLDVVAHVLIPGEPFAKERPRRVTRRVQGRSQTFWITPDTTLQAEARIATEFRAQAGPHHPQRHEVYGVAALFVTAITRYGAGSRGAKDGDNLAKLALDALNGTGYVDDRAVEDVSYRVVRGVPAPRTELLLYRLPDDV